MTTDFDLGVSRPKSKDDMAPAAYVGVITQPIGDAPVLTMSTIILVEKTV
jgi:hypothetical protein